MHSEHQRLFVAIDAARDQIDAAVARGDQRAVDALLDKLYQLLRELDALPPPTKAPGDKE